MKKVLIIVLSAVFILSLFGCSTKNSGAKQKTTSNTGKTVVYKDGIYDVKHKSTKPGYEEAVVTIASGKIQKIDLKRLDDNQKEVNYNDWDGTKNDYPNLKQYRLDLEKAMISKQSPDVSVVTGATQSSNGWKAAVSSALSKAQ